MFIQSINKVFIIADSSILVQLCITHKLSFNTHGTEYEVCATNASLRGSQTLIYDVVCINIRFSEKTLL